VSLQAPVPIVADPLPSDATDEDAATLAAEIEVLKAERDAIILAHNYQRAEVQDVADFVGDSLGLSRQAAATDASTVIFAGVHFMAETAKILAPDKTVVLPVYRAGCPMAEMISREDVLAWKADHPGVPVVMYVNSSADVKAVSDVCVTSANEVAVVRALGADRVLFGPDRNLAAWVASQIPNVEIIAWRGFCPTHERVTVPVVLAAKKDHPDAEVLAHPECRRDVLALADAVLSTSGMIRYAAASSSDSFIIVTEGGLLHALSKAAPGKRFYELDPHMSCPNMKLTTLASVRDALRSLEPAIEVAEDVRLAALGAVERMVAIG
jgi:quinolinate synthase